MGLEYERISFIEYLNKKKIFKNLIPELVEKKEPPIITTNKNNNHMFDGESLRDIPILDILLVNENKIVEIKYYPLLEYKSKTSSQKHAYSVFIKIMGSACSLIARPSARPEASAVVNARYGLSRMNLGTRSLH